MAVTADNLVQERAELEAVLHSGIFDRSPSLAQILAYVCQKHFEGVADQIKEYNIAVDVLGRPVEFDPKRDAIVRVQFHRLRERLAIYYEKEGAGRPLRIVIPQGQYIPQFIRQPVEKAARGEEREGAPLAEPSGAHALAEGALETPAIPSVKKTPWNQWAFLAGTLILLIATSLMFVVRKSKLPVPRVPPAGASPAVAFAGPDTVRILCGLKAGTFTDGFGRIWEPDHDFEGGNVVELPGQMIFGTRDPRLFQSRRQGQFRYSIPVAPGDYEVRLYFAETFFGEENTAGYGGEASRAFGIQINGKTVKSRLDVVGEVGASTADVKVYRDITPGGDGRIHISFVPIIGVPFLNAIEITPGTPGRLRPIRIVEQPRGYTDLQGRYWEPDRYAIGGVMIARSKAPEGAADPGLWAGERFGNLTYRIPVAPGTYTVNLYMAERWLGPGLPGGGGAGSRLFDILCNGVAVERDFDLFLRAGENRAFVYTMRGVKSNHQDQLVISLVPSKNFPLVNAIEVLDEGSPLS